MTPYEIIERPERDVLGEGAHWDEAEQALYWVDIVGRCVHQFNPSSGVIRRWATPSVCSAAIPTTRDDLIVALADGVHRLDPVTGATTPFCNPDPDARNRSNDTRTDPDGRLLLGTMFNNIGQDGGSVPSAAATGGLFRVEADASHTRLLGEIGISNALAFSPDGRRMTFSDTPRGVIWSFAYRAGEPLSDRQVLLQGGPGHPDGAAMDEEGCLWNARWGAGQVIRITPDGRIDQVLELPAVQPSCCAFGGADGRTLYITSARQNLESPAPGGLDPESLDGAVFAVRVDVAGLPLARFAG